MKRRAWRTTSRTWSKIPWLTTARPQASAAVISAMKLTSSPGTAHTAAATCGPGGGGGAREFSRHTLFERRHHLEPARFEQTNLIGQLAMALEEPLLLWRGSPGVSARIAQVRLYPPPIA